MRSIYMKSISLIVSLFVIVVCNKAYGMENSQAIDNKISNDSTPVKIMTYNIRHAAPIHHSIYDIHVDSIAAIINEEKPDLVALQEIDVHTGRSGVNLDQAKELGKLTNMNYYFSKSIDYDGGEYGVAILSRFAIKAHDRYSLQMPDSTGERRSVAVIRVEMFPGKEVLFASTHLDLKFENRMAQVNQLIKISRQSKYPLIVAGDFNSLPSGKEMQSLRKEFVFPCITDCPLTSPSDSPRVTIDYIVLNPQAAKILSVSDYKAINNITASDHLPLTANVKEK